MELKFTLTANGNLMMLVLIVPLWNWNCRVLYVHLKSFCCSNCTFMELKWCILIMLKLKVRVLIVPLWNWNWLRLIMLLKQVCVLIVPLWNWNKLACTIIEVLISSNCTFMELKWVWANKANAYDWSSNCTFMELKFNFNNETTRRNSVLIVPLWNWNTYKHN